MHDVRLCAQVVTLRESIATGTMTEVEGFLAMKSIYRKEVRKLTRHKMAPASVIRRSVKSQLTTYIQWGIK